MIKDFKAEVFRIFDEKWALVTAGTASDFNTMTISWGTLGSLWGHQNHGKNICTVFVKPARYTHKYMDENEYFTVSFFGKEYLKALGILGSKSGRDENKVELSGLTPVALEQSVTFEEAETTLVLRKIYRHDMDKQLMPADVVETFYKTEELKDIPHTMYIGEVVEIITK